MLRCDQHPEVELQAKRFGWYCASCADVVALFDEEAPLGDSVAGVDLAVLPPILAVPLREYQRAKGRARTELWGMCEVLEALLRLATAIRVGELLRAHDGVMPSGLVELLRDRLRAPTLGQWRQMAEGLCDAPVPDAVCPDLPPMVSSAVALLRGDLQLQELRNHLAHGVGITDAALEERLPAIRAAFELLVASSTWLGSTNMIARDEDGTWGRLVGLGRELRPHDGAFPDDAGEGARVFLEHGGRWLLLWPLLRYGPTGDTTSGDGECVSQVFSSRSEGAVSMTAIGSRRTLACVDRDVLVRAFEQLLPRPPRPQERSFEEEVRKDAATVVGRAAELERLRELEASADGGILWVHGQGGVGKSALVARFAADRIDSTPDSHVFVYRFRQGDDRCTAAAFAKALEARLRQWTVAAGLDPPAKEKGASPTRRVARLLAGLTRQRPILVLDGLDELAATDSRFARTLRDELAPRGGVWVCAGRPERGLDEVFGADPGTVEAFPGECHP